MAKELTLYVGNSAPFDVIIGTDLSGADLASITIMTAVGGTVILQRDVTAGNLSINFTDKKLTATLSGADADALAPGKYIAQAGVRFGDVDSWKFTDYFYTEIKASVVAKV